MSNGDRSLEGKVIGTCLLEKPIGHGGMSVVYLAKQTRPDRHVAVKIVRPDSAMDHVEYAHFLARFEREANIIARLEHANIIPIFAYGEQEQMAYLIMPYVSGGNLSELLKQQGKFSLKQAMNYLQQATDALDYAHAHGVIHRDLKPGNFLLYGDGRLVLADFGIAHVMRNQQVAGEATLTPRGMLMGTPAYIAPEMWQGQTVDHRVDIYALGIILFQMLSGKLPFQGADYFSLPFQHVHEPLPLLHVTDRDIPRMVDVVLQKATAKEKEGRYESAGQFASAFLSAITPSDERTARIASSFPNRPIVPVSMEPASDLRPIRAVEVSQGGRQTPQFPYAYNGEGTEPIPLASATPEPSNVISRKTRAPLSPVNRAAIIVIPIGIMLILLYFAGVFTGHLPGLVPPVLSTVSPTPTSLGNARFLVQQYYDDINQQKYMNAYGLLAPTFQQGLPYDSFVNGYAQTVRDDITFTNVQTRPDGTVDVVVTINATERVTGGVANNRYTWESIVAQQDGAWRILSATSKKL